MKPRHRLVTLFVSIAIVSGALPSLPAQGIHELRLLSDASPDLSDMESFVRSIARSGSTPEEKAIAVWRWSRRLRRQTSCAVEDGRLVFDPILHFNSYGAMNCGIISSLNISAWAQLGYLGRYIQLGDHTVSEVSWDRGATWHLFDSSMSIFCRNHEGRIASAEDIRRADACSLSAGRSEPGHVYLYHYFAPLGSHPGPTGWRCSSDQPVLYDRTLANGASSYTDGFSVDEYCRFIRRGRRYILGLRPGESYTRYWRPLELVRSGALAGPADPDCFRPMSDGTDPDGQHGLHNIRGNGVWVFRPDLREGEIDKHIYDRLPVAPGKPGHLTFKVSAANVIASLRIEARVFRRTREDGVRILVSKSAGIRWTPVWEASGTGVEKAQLALRDEVAGHTECLIRFEMRAALDARDVGLEAVSFDTITQLNRRALPRLRRGTNRISLRAGEALESIVLWPKLHGGGHLGTVHRAEGVHSAEETDGAYKATLGAAVDGKPGFAIWKLEAPTDIVRVRYAVVATNRSPRSRVALLHSWDGERFEEFFSDATGDGPFDREVLHEISGASVPPGRRTAWLQCLFETPEGAGTWNMPGIQDVTVEVQHRPRVLGTSPPLLVTYAWTEHRREGAVRRTHVERIEKLPHGYEIHVGGYRDPTMEWVRLALEGEASSEAPSPLGYSDGVDLGPSPPRTRSTFAWGENLALGKSYSTSRPSSEASGNGDEGSRELTNGIVIAPTELRTQAAVRPASAFWDRGGPVTIEIDLERVRSISAVRVVTHQPEASWCHPARLDFAVSEDGKSWTLVASATHDDVWNPPADDEPWEHEDSPRFAALPAGGRLVHAFQGVFPEPADARFVRVTAAALEGRGMGLSEIQVFDRVAIEPFPEDIVHGDGELPSGSKPKPGS